MPEKKLAQTKNPPKARKRKFVQIKNPVKGQKRTLNNGMMQRFDGKNWRKLCQDCGDNSPSYGEEDEKGRVIRRWCKSCAVKNHEDEYVDTQQVCQDCGEKRSNYGTIDDSGNKIRRWCKSCADKNHADEYVDFQAKCIECKKLRPSYGVLDEDDKKIIKWCKSCAEENHKDEYIDFHKKCQYCEKTASNYGLIDDQGNRIRSWCVPCAKKYHPDEYVCFLKKCSYESNEIKCDKQAKNGTDLCIRHHPDYVPGRSGCSKIGCKFIDDLCNQFGLDTNFFRHYHFNSDGSITGGEEKYTGTNYRADGFADMKKLYANPACSRLLSFSGLDAENKCSGLSIEFLGDAWHGNPSKYNRDKTFFGSTYGERHDKTKERFKVVNTKGYKVLYVWESDYKSWKSNNILDICKIYSESATIL